MTSDYLKALKLKKNLTNQELSDLSGVPVGTINRIMANQTDNPSFQTVCDIVIALDGSLDELAGTITDTALCGLGKSAALPVMSTLKLFRDEYLEHVVDKKCAAHVCTALRRFVISPERCKGCSKCARNCPAGAISGKIKEPFVIDDSRCIKCGACESACAFGAIHIEA